MTWIMPLYALYGVKYIDLVSLTPLPGPRVHDGQCGRPRGYHASGPHLDLSRALIGCIDPVSLAPSLDEATT